MLLDAAAGLAARDCDHAAQRAFHEEALAIRRRLGKPQPLAQSLVHVGAMLLKSGERQRGWTLLEEALALARQYGLGRYARHVLYQMTRVLIDEGDYATAQTRLHEILTGLRGSPDEWAAGAILELAGALAAQQGHPERALRLAAAGEAQRLAAGMTEQGEFGGWLARMLDPARKALDEEALATAMGQGQAITRHQAVTYALGDETA
jgi:tetratricopeptide (TPR) repeat protein